MLEHITRVDMPMKLVLQGYDYNFWPDWEKTTPGNDAGQLALSHSLQKANLAPASLSAA